MSDTIRVSEVLFTAASPEDAGTGLLGYLAFTVNGVFRFDCVALRKTARGRRALSFPKRKDSQGVEHPIIKPLGDARREVEAQVLAALGIPEDATG